MRILGIETSCDETAAAVVEFASPRGPRFERGPWSRNIDVKILSNVVHSQVATHRKTGGVVPEVAAREHVEKIIPVVEAALAPISSLRGSPWRPWQSHGDRGLLRAARNDGRPPIDAIAVTYGPGLITSLLVGVETARTLAWAWKVPLVAVNHMEGHIAAAFLRPRKSEARNPKSETNTKYQILNTKYPALALVVSGGHTELVLMKKPLDYKIIGATRDDAVGEAFDKVGKILGLEYPGGPVVSRLAQSGDPTVFPFSAPMIKSPDYDFSFSGIKTAVLYSVRKYNANTTNDNPNTANKRRTLLTTHYSLPSQIIADICASFQKAVVDVLVVKTIRAAKEYKVKTIILAGGVAANKQLREQLGKAIVRELRVIPPQRDPALAVASYELPMPPFCTDNAMMIAIAGYVHALKSEFTPWKKLDVDPNLSFTPSLWNS